MSNSVKILLNESVRHVGRVGDVVDVAPGYARNYLLPKGLAVEPTKANLKKVEERKKEIERQERELRAQQETLIKQLAGVEITIERRANEQGHLFGSVGASDIAHALQQQGHAVEAADISLPGKLDHIEKYNVVVRFADDLETEIKVWVAPDADSKAAIDAYALAHPPEEKPAAPEEPEADSE
ncbi:MAG TPA: 50S ribosomal protein L9 [Tepidisphaeraceae bacterium]|jgi:large subunit ribosomal protein L9